MSVKLWDTHVNLFSDMMHLLDLTALDGKSFDVFSVHISVTPVLYSLVAGSTSSPSLENADASLSYRSKTQPAALAVLADSGIDNCRCQCLRRISVEITRSAVDYQGLYVSQGNLIHLGSDT